MDSIVWKEVLTYLLGGGTVGTGIVLLYVYWMHSRVKRVEKMAEKIEVLEKAHDSCRADTSTQIAVFNVEIQHVKEIMTKLDDKLEKLLKLNGNRRNGG